MPLVFESFTRKTSKCRISTTIP